MMCMLCQSGTVNGGRTLTFSRVTDTDFRDSSTDLPDISARAASTEACTSAPALATATAAGPVRISVSGMSVSGVQVHSETLDALASASLLPAASVARTVRV